MGDVISQDRLQCKIIQKEFDELYWRYITRDMCILETSSITRIVDENSTKIVEFYSSSAGHIETYMTPKDKFLDFVQIIEWDFEFIKSDLLRVSITSSLWYDVYFARALTDDVIDFYHDILDRDVINNFGLMDEYEISGKLLLDRMQELQETFYLKFGKELEPSQPQLGV